MDDRNSKFEIVGPKVLREFHHEHAGFLSAERNHGLVSFSNVSSSRSPSLSSVNTLFDAVLLTSQQRSCRFVFTEQRKTIPLWTDKNMQSFGMILSRHPASGETVEGRLP